MSDLHALLRSTASLPEQAPLLDPPDTIPGGIRVLVPEATLAGPRSTSRSLTRSWRKVL